MVICLYKMNCPHCNGTFANLLLHYHKKHQWFHCSECNELKPTIGAYLYPFKKAYKWKLAYCYECFNQHQEYIHNSRPDMAQGIPNLEANENATQVGDN